MQFFAYLSFTITIKNRNRSVYFSLRALCMCFQIKKNHSVNLSGMKSCSIMHDVIVNCLEFHQKYMKRSNIVLMFLYIRWGGEIAFFCYCHYCCFCCNVLESTKYSGVETAHKCFIYSADLKKHKSIIYCVFFSLFSKTRSILKYILTLIAEKNTRSNRSQQ